MLTEKWGFFTRALVTWVFLVFGFFFLNMSLKGTNLIASVSILKEKNLVQVNHV